MSHLLGIGATRQTKCRERNFDFCPTARENRAGRRGWLGGRPKFLNFNIFYKKPPPCNRAPVAFAFMQLFDLTHPEGPRGIPVPGGGKIKSPNWAGCYRRDLPLKSNSKNVLFYSTFGCDTAPQLYPSKSSKWGLFSGLLYKNWEFGGCIKQDMKVTI